MEMHPKRRDDPAAKRPAVRDRELDKMIAAAWAAGWWCERGGRNHVRCLPPDPTKAIVTVASTPSDHKAIPNTRSAFRRSGLAI